MVTVISRFKVRNGFEREVSQAFLNRPRLVEKAPGFHSLDVLTDAKDPSIFLLVTRWKDEESFRAWHRSEAHHESHAFIPKGLKLDASFTSVTIGESIQNQSEILNLNDALESQTEALSQWLADSDAVFALLLAPDGTIRSRNLAALRVFPPSTAGDPKKTIWEYLVSWECQNLRQRLSDPHRPDDNSFLLNLADGIKSPVTWVVQLLRCSGAFLLVGNQEYRRDSQFQDEILKLTNDLSITIREAAQKNRELQKANETIELLVRTDSLTGLANRRMLEETLPRETSRANRLNENLSAVFLDLDRLKLINDQFGHRAGDQVLASVGKLIKSQLRSYSLAARAGGDEFVLLLPGTDKNGAILVAERIREKVTTLILPDCPLHVSVSVGVASIANGETGEELVARADGALYRAKEKGGNAVEVA